MKSSIEFIAFVIMLVIFIILFYTANYMAVGTWDLNRTIGWGWDITNYLMWGSSIFYWSVFLFMIGYGILCIANRTTQKQLTILHVCLLFLYLIIPVFRIELKLITGVVVWLVFILNLLLSKNTPSNNFP